MRCLAAIAGRIAPLLLLLTATPTPTAAAPPASRPLVNERCPVTIEEFATPSHEIRWVDHFVRFCCEKCQRRFEADPAAYVINLPQLPRDVVERTVLDAHGGVRPAQVAGRIDRWTRPVLLTLAGLIAVWLAVRIVRRRSGEPSTPAS